MGTDLKAIQVLVWCSETAFAGAPVCSVPTQPTSNSATVRNIPIKLAGLIRPVSGISSPLLDSSLTLLGSVDTPASQQPHGIIQSLRVGLRTIMMASRQMVGLQRLKRAVSTK